jgi:hypothetical protein
MRRFIVSIAMSLDGYYTGPDDNVMVLELDPAFDAYNAERLRAADTLLLGRRSFEGFKSFWPPVADDPDPRWTAAQREMSRLDNAIAKVVVSDSLTSEQTEPWQDTTRIVSRADAPTDCRAPTPNRQRRPGRRQPHALERPAGSRTGRRAAPDGRPGCRRRRHADLRRPTRDRLGASTGPATRQPAIAAAYRHTRLGRLGERPHPVRSQPGNVNQARQAGRRPRCAT